MAKLINRDALLDALNETMRRLAVDLPEEAAEILEVVETAIRECVYDLDVDEDEDGEPVSGEWVHSADGSVHCSECGTDINPNDIAPYCPICGAHMEGETDEDE